jgi:DNA-binding MarR family transcriptional regulator
MVMHQQPERYGIPMARTRWLDEREAHLWRTWLRVNQELPGLLADLLNQESGLSAADYAVLVPLSESPDGMVRARDLGREIFWDRSRLSHQVRRMESRGLVAREECEADARGAMIRLTPAGRSAIRAAAPGHVAATREYFFDLVSDREIVVLTKVFERVLAHLGCDERVPRS